MSIDVDKMFVWCPVVKRTCYILLIQFVWYPAGTFLFKVNNENTRTLYETCSKLSIMAPERLCWCRSRVIIVNFKDILYLFLVFLLLFSTVTCLLDFWFLNRFQFFDFSPFIADKLRFIFFSKAAVCTCSSK